MKKKEREFINFILICIIAAVILGSASCSLPSSSGYVVDSKTKEPLNDVRVSCDYYKITSSGVLHKFNSFNSFSNTNNKGFYHIKSPEFSTETDRHFLPYTGIIVELTFRKFGYFEKSVYKNRIKENTVFLEKKE